MRTEELKTLIAEEMMNNPSNYREAIVPAVAESKIGVIEMVGSCFESIGISMTAPQIKKLAEIDLARATPLAITKKWEDDGGVFTVNDFPNWVIAKLEKDDISAKEIVKRAAIEMFAFVKGSIEWCCLYNGEAHFNKRGYKFLIMSSESRGWMSNIERKRWQKESGLFVSA